MRKIVITGIGILILVGAFGLSTFFKNSKKQPPKSISKNEKVVFTETIKNNEIPIVITADGNLVAKNKVELFTEVQGVLQATGKEFRAGVNYRKGETLLRINNEEHYATLQAQKSSLQNLIVSIMPDMRLDYPEAFDKWNQYLQNFDINKSVQKLPETSSDKEKYFVTGKNIYATYYNIKNLEARLLKYNIRAPFSGILTEVLVTQGTLVRAGQKMGEFINPNIYELEVSINAAYVNILSKGKEVILQDLEKTQNWTGTVSRINGRIDQNTQTVKVYINVKGKDLREGMYLEAKVPAKSETNVYEISRKLLVENKSVYVVKDSVLDLVEIKPIYFNENTVIVRGLNDGTQLVNKPISGGYSGMKVRMISENK